MKFEEFHTHLKARGFSADDCGLAIIYARGKQMIVAPVIDGPPTYFYASVTGVHKAKDLKQQTFPQDVMAADRMLNELAQLENSQPVGNPVEAVPFGQHHVTPLSPWEQFGKPSTVSGSPPCQDFSRRTYYRPSTRHVSELSVGERNLRRLRTDVKRSEDELRAKLFRSKRVDDLSNPHLCAFEVVYTFPVQMPIHPLFPKMVFSTLRQFSATRIVDLSDNAPLTRQILANKDGRERVEFYRANLLELTELMACGRALRHIKRALLDIDTARRCASTLADIRERAATAAKEERERLKAQQVHETKPTFYHITIDGTPLCADFDKFTTKLREKAHEQFGAIPRCGYSEEAVAEAFADIVRAMVPDANVEVVTKPCPAEADNEQLRQEKYQ